MLPPVLKAVWRPRVIGLEHIPRDGGVHPRQQPPQLRRLHASSPRGPRKVVFLAKSDYFNGRGVKGTAQRLWFEGIGMLPVDRDDTQAAIDSLDTALEVLGRGEAFGIYPEGSRSRDGRLYRGRTGVAHLALTAGVPVVPVGLQGTEKIQPVGVDAAPSVVAKVTVTFGEPLDFTGRADGVPLGRARREVTDEIMAGHPGAVGPGAGRRLQRPRARGLTRLDRPGDRGRVVPARTAGRPSRRSATPSATRRRSHARRPSATSVGVDPVEHQLAAAEPVEVARRPCRPR